MPARRLPPESLWSRDVILTRHNTLLFLLNHRLLSIQDLVEHCISVRNRSQRNRGFSVTWRNGQGYYVKQHQPDAGPWEACSSVVNEARVLGLLDGIPGTPALRLFDPQRQALVLDWQIHPVSCAERALRDGLPCVDTAALLGGALAKLHGRLATLGRMDGNGRPFSAEPPWVLSFRRLHPLAGEDQSWAQARLVALIGEQGDILPALTALAGAWPTGQLIHGDMKWQNCLLRATETEEPPCVFIDWEMAALGDPLWDLAGLAQSWLKAWLDALEILPGDDQQALTARGAEAFAVYRPALAALWNAYLSGHSDSSPVRFAALCGARLVQTLYEDCADEEHLSSVHLLLLQLASNLLHRPAEAATYLLGTP
ncbi:hypothetical protein IPC436_26500 [Pseudomonas aeruginosa]|nr:hypothetical protein IPC436_26500 [Pseudomonas aeruginosa]